MTIIITSHIVHFVFKHNGALYYVYNSVFMYARVCMCKETWLYLL